MGTLADPTIRILSKIPDVDNQLVRVLATRLDNVESMAVAGASIAQSPTGPVIGAPPSNPRYFKLAGENNNASHWQNAGYFQYSDNGTTLVTQIDNAGYIFNEQGSDIDFRIEGDTATNLFKIDAGLDAVQIGTTTAGNLADFRSSTIVFNEDGADRDIRFEGNTEANLLYLDAGNNRVGIGTASPAATLQVYGHLFLDNDGVVSPDLRFIDSSANSFRLNFISSTLQRIAFTPDGSFIETYDIRDRDGVGANNNSIEQLLRMETDTGGIQSVGSQKWTMTDATDGAENSSWRIKTVLAGLFQERLTVSEAGYTGIGTANVAPAAQLDVDQSSATAAIPVLLLDQGDASEQAILISYDGADVDMILIDVDVTGDPQFGWSETPNVFTLNKGLTITGTLDTDGFIGNTVEKSSGYTATATDFGIMCDASGGGFTITLPAATSHTGRVYHIKKIDSSGNIVTVDGNSSETIDDATTAVLTAQYESITIQCDGDEWFIL